MESLQDFWWWRFYSFPGFSCWTHLLCLHLLWVVAVVSIILSCGKAGAGSAHTHTHTQLFEIITYLTQLNNKDRTLFILLACSCRMWWTANKKAVFTPCQRGARACWGPSGLLVRCGIPNWGDSAHASPLAPACEGAADIAIFVFAPHPGMFYMCEIYVRYFSCFIGFTELPRLRSFSNQ